MRKSILLLATLGLAVLPSCVEDREPEPRYRVVEEPVVVQPYYPDQYYYYGGSYYYWHPEHRYYVRMREPPRGPNIHYQRVDRLPPPPRYEPHLAPHPGPPPGPRR